MANAVKDQLTSDHAELYDTVVARSYFAQFDRITGHLTRVAAEMEKEGAFTRTETRVLGTYLAAIRGDVCGAVAQVPDDGPVRGRADASPLTGTKAAFPSRRN